MNRTLLAHAVVVLGILSVVCGVFGVGGWQPASIVAGVFAIAYGLLFIDVDSKSKPRISGTIERRQR